MTPVCGGVSSRVWREPGEMAMFVMFGCRWDLIGCKRGTVFFFLSDNKLYVFLDDRVRLQYLYTVFVDQIGVIGLSAFHCLFFFTKTMQFYHVLWPCSSHTSLSCPFPFPLPANFLPSVVIWGCSPLCLFSFCFWSRELPHQGQTPQNRLWTLSCSWNLCSLKM